MKDCIRRVQGAAFCIGMLCAASSATAGDSGWYLGYDMGSARYPGSRPWGLDGITFTGNAGRNAFTADFVAGYRLDRYFSLETGFVDLGGSSGLVRGPAGPNPAQGDLSVSAKGLTLDVVVSLPVSRKGDWDIFMKAGVMRGDYYMDFAGAAGEVTLGSKVHVFDVHPLFGLGVEHEIIPGWTGRLGVDTYRDVGSTDRLPGRRISGPDITTVTLGGSHRF
jgi:hypothetical protein